MVPCFALLVYHPFVFGGSMNHLELYIEGKDLQKIRECRDVYLKSDALVQILFKDRKDPAGQPYLGHLKRVSSRMTTLDGKVAGLLHDLVEDIPYITFEDLLDIGIPENIVEVLRLVTKKKTNEQLTEEERLIRYGKEIDRIIDSGNPLAIELKTVDITDNYNKERLELCSPELQDWFEKKYPPQIKKLYKAREIYNCA